MDRNNLRLVIAIGALSVFLGLYRIIPHPPNFTPIIASAVVLPWLFGWRPITVLPPLFAMLIGDLYWGFHSYMLYTYASIVLVVLASLRTQSVWLGALTGSVVFFLVTNFGVWLSGYYGYTLSGLITCYVMAIPFYTNTVISTFVYTAVLVFIYRTVAGFSPVRQTS
jgi:hypothetical protein